MVDRSDDPKPVAFRRFEVIEGAGRRRRWPTAMKAAIVAESLAPGAVVAQVARRHDVRAQQIHDWRRDARAGRLVLPGLEHSVGGLGMAFVEAVVDPAAGSARLPATPPARTSRPDAAALTIEAQGVVVRVGAAADARLVEATIRALRSRP